MLHQNADGRKYAEIFLKEIKKVNIIKENILLMGIGNTNAYVEIINYFKENNPKIKVVIIDEPQINLFLKTRYSDFISIETYDAIENDDYLKIMENLQK
ncbi:MAG: hypothetical protein HUJ68_10655 [Clostridia bacterium]|nr:hypothetical protein [Clostridia bacterium]